MFRLSEPVVKFIVGPVKARSLVVFFPWNASMFWRCYHPDAWVLRISGLRSKLEQMLCCNALLQSEVRSWEMAGLLVIVY